MSDRELTIFEAPAVAQVAGPPCACCGAPSESVIWLNPICDICAGAWHEAPGFTAKEVGMALALPAYCAEATKRTQAWVAARRSKLARRAP